MQSLLAAALVYGFTAGTSADYRMTTTFDGFIPILGGQTGKAEVKLEFNVRGIEPIKDQYRASSELTKAEIFFNDTLLPLGLDAVKDFFPKTTIEFTPEGRILKTDAPDIQLPVKLPGLDVKRFPDISYLPIEFPKDDRKTWSFKKSFGGSDVTYTCSVAKADEKTVTLDVKMKQVYTVLESASLEVVTDKEDAENEVTTELNGSGTAIYERKRGLFQKVDISATATSKVRALTETKPEETRMLKTRLLVELIKPSSD